MLHYLYFGVPSSSERARLGEKLKSFFRSERFEMKDKKQLRIISKSLFLSERFGRLTD